MSPANILLPAALVCVIAAPFLVAYMFYALFRMGRSIEAANPALWNEMKPGFYSDIRVSRSHRRRLNSFVSNREYLSLNIQGIDELVRRYKLARSLGTVAVIGGALAAIIGLALQ